MAHGSVMYVVGEGGIGVPRRIKAWEIVNDERVENLYRKPPDFSGCPA